MTDRLILYNLVEMKQCLALYHQFGSGSSSIHGFNKHRFPFHKTSKIVVKAGKNKGGNLQARNVNFLLQIAIGAFALGFIDAGYSGDWSRIGVLSKDNEELLRGIAYVVVPLSLALIVILNRKVKEEP